MWFHETDWLAFDNEGINIIYTVLLVPFRRFTRQHWSKDNVTEYEMKTSNVRRNYGRLDNSVSYIKDMISYECMGVDGGINTWYFYANVQQS